MHRCPFRGVAFAAVLWLIVSEEVLAKSRGRGSKWWGITKAGEPITLLINAKSGADLNLDQAIQVTLRKKQKKLIRQNKGILIVVARAAKIAVHECRHQFRYRRWNCPTNTNMLRGKYLFGKIVDKGCPETSFIYAITSAAVTQAIARACADGTIDTCSCGHKTSNYLNSFEWEKGGCSDNVEFGFRFSRDFVDAGESGRDLRYLMNLHNNEAGRLHVQSELRKECKCHGMSGSCTMKTCWMKLPHFRAIGDKLKDRFDGATRIVPDNAGYRDYGKKKYHIKLKPYDAYLKPPTRKDLVYYEKSPNFCNPDPKQGIQGTKGRLCNETSMGVNGCDIMCCGRGYRTEVRKVIERCKCTFQWCCDVKCKTCQKKKTVHICL